MFETGGDSPEKIVKDEGLIQISDEGGELKKNNKKKNINLKMKQSIIDYRNGKDRDFRIFSRASNEDY